MAKQKLELNKKKFQAIVDELETAQTFTNPSALWTAVEGTEWAKNLQPRPLTAAVAYMRAKEMGIVIKTLSGKRGRSKGDVIPRGGPRVPRKEKLKRYAKNFERTRLELPMYCRQQYTPVVERAASGSLKAAVKLKCLDCSNYQPVEIRLCQCFSCPLYAYRPFKTPEEKMAKAENSCAT